MAQSRLIPRNLPSMPYYNDLEPIAKLLYLSFWLEADDEGCFNPGMILASEGQTIKKDPFISLLARRNQFINPFIGPVIDNEIYTIFDFFPTNRELLLQPYFQPSRYHNLLCERYPWIEEYEYTVLNDALTSSRSKRDIRNAKRNMIKLSFTDYQSDELPHSDSDQDMMNHYLDTGDIKNALSFAKSRNTFDEQIRMLALLEERRNIDSSDSNNSSAQEICTVLLKAMNTLPEDIRRRIRSTDAWELTERVLEDNSEIINKTGYLHTALMHLANEALDRR